MDSIALSTRGSLRGGSWRTRILADAARLKLSTPTPKIRIPITKRNAFAYKQARLRDAALSWCHHNCGTEFSIGSPGSRTAIPGIAMHLVKTYGEIFEQPNGEDDGNCMEAAIMNSVDIALGQKDAKALRAYVAKEIPHLL